MTVLVAFNKMDANWRRATSASKRAADRGLPVNQEELLHILLYAEADGVDAAGLGALKSRFSAV
jgi:hypothetical protein